MTLKRVKKKLNLKTKKWEARDHSLEKWGNPNPRTPHKGKRGTPTRMVGKSKRYDHSMSQFLKKEGACINIVTYKSKNPVKVHVFSRFSKNFKIKCVIMKL